jgi:hypothetical protein
MLGEARKNCAGNGKSIMALNILPISKKLVFLVLQGLFFFTMSGLK